MKKLLFFLLAPFMIMVSSCDSLQPEETFQDETVLKSAGKKANFRTHLSGDQEVPAVETNATGQAIFQLSKDGSELSYKLIVANINNVLQAHIHLGAAGTNGGVVAFLYPSAPPAVLIEGKSNGILAQGIIKAENLRGALAGASLEDLIEHIREDNAYVNVHTSAYTSGEIRGQIKGN